MSQRDGGLVDGLARELRPTLSSTTAVVIDLAKALGVTTDELLGLKPPKAKAEKLVDDDPDARRLWKTFQLVLALPDRDRRAVIRLVHSLVRTSDPSPA